MSSYEAAQKRRDVVVGIFVICGLAALGWMVFKFNDLPAAVSRMRSFQVAVRFPSAPGVQRDTPVRFCGYQIGRVTEVMAPRVLENKDTGQKYHQTTCILSINKQYRDIPSNVEVKLMARGLGSSYIELRVDPNKLPAPPKDPNRPETRFLVQGLDLQGSTGMTSEFFPEESQDKLDKLVESIRTFLGNANEIIGDPNSKQNVKAILANFADATHDATVILEQVPELIKQFQETLDKFDRAVATGEETFKGFDAKAERLVGSIVDTSAEIGRTFSELRLAMEKVNSGDGTAARFINDGRLYENLLESTNQLNILLKDFKDLIDKISTKGLRSVL